MYFSTPERRNIVAFLSLLLMAGGALLHTIAKNYHWQGFSEYAVASSPAEIPTPHYEKPPLGASVVVPVIVYHSVRPTFAGETEEVKRYSTEPEVFESELMFLRDNGYHVISFSEMLNYFDKGTPLPTKPVILTFDDGWKNQYVYAFPLLKKYGFVGTFFVFTSAIDHKHFMSWDELKEMDAVGMTIGGHTKTHPYLTRITDPVLLANEIAGGKKVLEEHLEKTVDVFAYPFGLNNLTIIKEVTDAGYRIGRTSNEGKQHTEESLPVLTALYDTNDLNRFIKLVSGQ